MSEQVISDKEYAILLSNRVYKLAKANQSTLLDALTEITLADDLDTTRIKKMITPKLTQDLYNEAMDARALKLKVREATEVI